MPASTTRSGGGGIDSRAMSAPPLRGGEAGRQYAVDLRVLDREGQHLIWSRELAFGSNISDTIVPDQPLTIGPGYARNPAAGR